MEEIRKLVIAKVSNIVSYSAESLMDFKKFMMNQEIRNYLMNCLPIEVYEASGIRVLTLENIREESAEDVAPGGYIFPYGYLVIATSIGGNAVCFHSDTGKVFWADHASFRNNRISYEDRATGQWIDLEFTEDNIQKALVLLSTSIEEFLINLLSEQLTDRLDDLD